MYLLWMMLKLFGIQTSFGADVSLIVGTILEDWAPDIADNVTDRNDFFKAYKDIDKAGRRGSMKGYRVIEGGRQFIDTIFTNVNGTFGGYADRATIRTDVGNPIKEAQYEQRIVAGSINLSTLEDAQNVPKYQIHDIAKVKKEEAEFSMTEIMGAAALSDGVTDTSIPHGLQLIISALNNTVGTIDGAANAFWRPQRDLTGVAAWNTGDEGLIALDAIFQQAKRGPEKPNLLVARPDIVTLINIMNITTLQININQGAPRSDIGVVEGGTSYRNAKVIADDNVPSGTLFGVNTRHLPFKVLRKGEFKTTKMKQPVDGLFSVQQLYVFSNFTCSSRRLQFLMTGIVT